MNKIFEYDLYRYYGKSKLSIIEKIKVPLELKYIKYLRKGQQVNNVVMKKIYTIILMVLKNKTHIQIPINTKIGKGFYIGHCGRVIINHRTIIGENVNVGTGVTIGRENRGKRKGTPIIGNNVWIGTNSVICGKIKIGNDVMIAPLTFVNFDVPNHSIVIGNPAKIIRKENATDNYIQNIIENIEKDI